MEENDARVSTILTEIVRICREVSEINEIILFGSRAKGTHMFKSDIDIALKGFGIDLEAIRDEVDEIDTLLKIDLVDLDTCKNKRLVEEVEKDGISLYRKV